MGKSTSVYLSDENAEFLEDHDNTSALLNRLVTEFREGGQASSAIKRYKLEEERASVRELEARLEVKRELLDELSSSVETLEDRREDVIAEAVEKLTISPSKGHDHDAAELWADKADLPPEEFWERYTARWAEVNDEPE